jgi:hypothetical protein
MAIEIISGHSETKKSAKKSIAYIGGGICWRRRCRGETHQSLAAKLS